MCNIEHVIDNLDYAFENAEKLAWLGDFLGHDTSLKELYNE